MGNLPASLMTAAEAAALELLAADRRVLELGAWHGEQTARMAKVAKVVWSVDRHTGDVHTGPADTLAPYLHTLHEHHVQDNVVTVVADFVKVFFGVRYSMFDLVVVDGAHDAHSLLRDWFLSLPLVCRDGVIAVHDWGRFDTLTVLRQETGEPDSLVETLAVFEARRYK